MKNGLILVVLLISTICILLFILKVPKTTLPQNISIDSASSAKIIDRTTQKELVQINPISSTSDVTTHTMFEEKVTTKQLFNLIDEEQWVYLEDFHDANQLCGVTLEYETKSEFLANYYEYSQLELSRAEQIFDDCAEVEIKSFEELEKIYLTSLAKGHKGAEYTLGILYPNGFLITHFDQSLLYCI